MQLHRRLRAKAARPLWAVAAAVRVVVEVMQAAVRAAVVGKVVPHHLTRQRVGYRQTLPHLGQQALTVAAHLLDLQAQAGQAVAVAVVAGGLVATVASPVAALAGAVAVAAPQAQAEQEGRAS